MFLRMKLYWVIPVLVFWPVAFLFSGEVYRWIEENGTIHFTDDVSKIPEQVFHWHGEDRRPRGNIEGC
jgi:hypothetical protein